MAAQEKDHAAMGTLTFGGVLAVVPISSLAVQAKP